MKTPKFWYRSKSFYQILLMPLTSIWILGNYFRKLFSNPIKFNIPVICIGNLIAGGGGKTPLTIKVARILIKKGYNVHIVKKQYKSKNKERVILVDENSNPLIAGDEAILSAKVAKTWLTKNRAFGINKAIDCGAELVILDDGYQDYSIKKDFNILTVKESQEFGNKSLIPAGPLRENIEEGLNRADHIFYYGSSTLFKKKYLRNAIPVSSIKVTFSKNIILKEFKNKNVLAFAGIAHPQNFFTDVSSYGLNIVKKFEFPDHYKYSRKDINRLILISENFKLTIATTEKDYVKIPEDLRYKIFAIPLQIEFNEKAFYKNLKLKLGLHD